MTDIYYMPRESIKLVPAPPSKLLVIIIRDYPRKYNKTMRIFKEFLDGAHHINKYCKIKPLDDHMKIYTDRFWHITQVKPENVYIFPFTRSFLELINSMKWFDRLVEYVYGATFYKESNEYPVEYRCVLGSLLVEEENIANIRSAVYDL